MGPFRRVGISIQEKACSRTQVCVLGTSMSGCVAFRGGEGDSEHALINMPKNNKSYSRGIFITVCRAATRHASSRFKICSRPGPEALPIQYPGSAPRKNRSSPVGLVVGIRRFGSLAPAPVECDTSESLLPGTYLVSVSSTCRRLDARCNRIRSSLNLPGKSDRSFNLLHRLPPACNSHRDHFHAPAHLLAEEKDGLLHTKDTVKRVRSYKKIARKSR